MKGGQILRASTQAAHKILCATGPSSSVHRFIPPGDLAWPPRSQPHAAPLSTVPSPPPRAQMTTSGEGGPAEKGPCSSCGKVWEPGMNGWSGGPRGRQTRWSATPPHGRPAWSCKTMECQRAGGYAPPLGADRDRSRDRSREPVSQPAPAEDENEYLSKLVSIRGMRCAAASFPRLPAPCHTFHTPCICSALLLYKRG